MLLDKPEVSWLGGRYTRKEDLQFPPEIVEVTFAVLVTVASIVSATVAVALPFALTHPWQIR